MLEPERESGDGFAEQVKTAAQSIEPDQRYHITQNKTHVCREENVCADHWAKLGRSLEPFELLIFLKVFIEKYHVII